MTGRSICAFQQGRVKITTTKFYGAIPQQNMTLWDIFLCKNWELPYLLASSSLDVPRNFRESLVNEVGIVELLNFPGGATRTTEGCHPEHTFILLEVFLE